MTSADVIFANQQVFANNAAAAASSFVATLVQLANTAPVGLSALGLPTPQFTTGAAGGDITSTQNFIRLFRPPNPTANIAGASLPLYVSQTVGQIPNLNIPDFGVSAPSVVIPPTPDSSLPTTPSAQSLDPVTLPGAPSIVFPNTPTVTSIVVPDAPSLTIPSFSANFPLDDLVVPTNTFQFSEVPYQDAMLDAAKAKLLSDLQNGSYGIDVNDENSLWQRARDRETEASLLAIEDVMSTQAARGFPLPPGAAQVQLERVVHDYTQKVSSMNRDIAVKRGEWYVENRKFTLDEVQKYEQMLISYYMSQMERALNVARYTVDFAIQLYNANIARFNARIQAFTAQVTAYEAQIRGALAVVEQYRAIMEGKRLQVAIQAQFIDIYKAQLDAIQTQENIFRTQMEAAKLATDIQRLKIDTFKAAIDAYVAQVQGKVATFNMYDAQIRGQTSLVENYKAQTQAYATTVSAFETKARIGAINVDAQYKNATIALESYKAQLDAYRITLDTQIRQVNAAAAIYASQVGEYNADISAITESYKLAQASYQIDHDLQIKNADIAIENAKVGLQAIQTAGQINIGAATVGASYYGQLVAGATAALNAIATTS